MEYNIDNLILKKKNYHLKTKINSYRVKLIFSIKISMEYLVAVCWKVQIIYMSNLEEGNVEGSSSFLIIR